MVISRKFLVSYLECLLESYIKCILVSYLKCCLKICLELLRRIGDPRKSLDGKGPIERQTHAQAEEINSCEISVACKE